MYRSIRPCHRSVQIAVFFLCCLTGTAYSLPERVSQNETFWKSLKEDLQTCLSQIRPGIPSIELGLELRDGERVVGTGSLKLARDKRASFILSTPDGSCRFFSHGATATCLLASADDQVRFDTASDGACPFPVIRIGKHPEQGFQLDVVMNLGRISASTPVDLDVHPETADHLITKMRDRFPWAETVGDLQRFHAAATEPMTLELRREGGRVVGFRAAVSREGKPPFWVAVDPIKPGIDLPTLPVTLLPDGGTIPLSSLESVMRFIKGFYGILSSLIPR